jgi:hypothetical protein
MSRLASQLQVIGRSHRSLTDDIERKSRVPYGPKALVPSIIYTALEAADQSSAFLHDQCLAGMRELAGQNTWWQAIYQQKDAFILFKDEFNRAALVIYLV